MVFLGGQGLFVGLGTTTMFEILRSQAGKFFAARKESPIVPTLESPVRVPYGPFKFRISVSKGQEFQLQRSTNLTIWDRMDFDNTEESQSEYVDTNAKNQSACFYRISSTGLQGNILGYISMTLPPGYSIISNPLKSGSPTIQALFRDLPEGTAINKFDATTSKLRSNIMKNRRWQDPNQTLEPGEGALILNPTDDYKTLNFVGEVPQGSQLYPVPAGFTLRGSMLPISGRLDTDLKFPIEPGDVFHVFDSGSQNYKIYTYRADTWEKDPVMLGLGEGFWVGKTTPKNWRQSLITPS